jgi:phytoene dehydrogenase-like protein
MTTCLWHSIRMPQRPTAAEDTFDDLIIGGGHNGLIAACYLARAGRRVCLLEARPQLGGATLSSRIFPGVDARISKYSYLISLLPQRIRKDLRIPLRTIRRSVASYTPNPGDPGRGLLIPSGDPAAVEREIARFAGSPREAVAWTTFYERINHAAGQIFDTLTQPLPSRAAMRNIVADDGIWEDFFVRPLGEVLERTFQNDTIRGIVLTDGLIGTFADAHDPTLRQNICFLYHVIGNGSGEWTVPVGGMGALVDALAATAAGLGVVIRTSCPVTSVKSDGHRAEVSCLHGQDEQTLRSETVLANCAPAILEKLLGNGIAGDPPLPALWPGAQIKVNMLLKRLPALRDASVDPASAFRGTFHVNEGYQQLQQAYSDARVGRIPSPLPLEIYCHSLSDPSILGPELQAAGAHTLTLFSLHSPHGLFPPDDRETPLQAVLTSLNSVLSEPIENCLWIQPDGRPCIEVNTTADLERDLNIPGGNIFHTPLDWPFSDDPAEIGTWGVATPIPNLVICGSGARRGGAVSGIPGHNAAQHVLHNFPSNR